MMIYNERWIAFWMKMLIGVKQWRLEMTMTMAMKEAHPLLVIGGLVAPYAHAHQVGGLVEGLVGFLLVEALAEAPVEALVVFLLAEALVVFLLARREVRLSTPPRRKHQALRLSFHQQALCLKARRKQHIVNGQIIYIIDHMGIRILLVLSNLYRS